MKVCLKYRCTLLSLFIRLEKKCFDLSKERESGEVCVYLFRKHGGDKIRGGSCVVAGCRHGNLKIHYEAARVCGHNCK